DSNIIYSEIGKHVSIAAMTRINPGNHPTWRATQSHFTYRAAQYFPGEADEEEFFAWRRAHKVNIGHDVWIGHGAVVMPGVKVGIGAVIGSGAVVTKDVEAYTVAVGVPAKPIKRRFPPEIVAKLLAIAWWDWDRPALEARFEDFLGDIDSFVEKYG
ncbi:MAG: acetyltransferase, partial [Chloroflexales bacterium]|nr:acetyltransferase [Chloroflexales bacterium]